MAEATIQGQATLEGGPEITRRVSPTEYRTFSRKLAPALTGLGGILAVTGGLGTWIRTAKATRLGDNLTESGAGMGYSEPLGWVLAGLGAIAVIGSVAWMATSFYPKLIPIFASVAVALITAQRLPDLDRQVDRMVAEATSKLGFTDYHAGFGWGAWLLLVASVLLLLGALVGILREMDLRKGIPE
jgi:hypothetical protein